eukprot:gene13786-4715_t
MTDEIKELELEELFSQAKDRYVGIPTGEDVVGARLFSADYSYIWLATMHLFFRLPSFLLALEGTQHSSAAISLWTSEDQVNELTNVLACLTSPPLSYIYCSKVLNDCGIKVLTPTEEVIQRIQSNPSVQGFLIVDCKGIIKRSSVDLARAIDYKVATKKLVAAARYVVKNLDPRDDLKFLRIRTKSTEIMLGPENGDTLVVIQSLPNPYSKERNEDGLKKEK